jgi:MFS transporter, DHA2 family, multidrug resistance protein
LPFLFVPVNAVAYSDLREDRTNQASALINVARNLGGRSACHCPRRSWRKRAQFYQSRLVESLVASSISYQQGLSRVMNAFVAQGSAPLDAQHQAVGWIAQAVQQQATLLAYIDVFWSTAVVALLLVPLALSLRPIDPAARRPVGH